MSDSVVDPCFSSFVLLLFKVMANVINSYGLHGCVQKPDSCAVYCCFGGPMNDFLLLAVFIPLYLINWIPVDMLSIHKHPHV